MDDGRTTAGIWTKKNLIEPPKVDRTHHFHDNSNKSSLRIKTLLQAGMPIQLPAVCEGEPGPTIPVHVAGILKRMLKAYRVGIPMRILLNGYGLCMGTSLTPDILRWFEAMCISRCVTMHDSESGMPCVNLSNADLDKMLPINCRANWKFASFFEISSGEFEEEKDQYHRGYDTEPKVQKNAKLKKIKTADLSETAGMNDDVIKAHVGSAGATSKPRPLPTFSKNTMIELIRLQLSVCNMISERKEWFHIVIHADTLLQKCLTMVLSETQQELVCSIFMSFMIEFGLAWHGWFYTDDVELEDKESLKLLIHKMSERLDSITELMVENEPDTPNTIDFIFDGFMDSVGHIGEMVPAVEPRPMFGRDDPWESDLFDFDIILDGEDPSTHLVASSFIKCITGTWNPVTQGKSAAATQRAAGSALPAGYADSALHRKSLSAAVTVDSDANSGGSDLISLVTKMRRFFTTDTVAVFQSSFFSTYYRNPKQSIRGFPCLPGGVDYSETLHLQRTGRGGGAWDRMPVILDVYLETSPKGGVWVAAEIQELEIDLGGALGEERPTSCTCLAELKTLFGKEVVIAQATMQDASSKKNRDEALNKKKKYSVSILPRAWKFKRSLHKKGTRQIQQFVLRAHVWVFSPRGVGVLATRVDSSPFVLSSTQNLRKQKKRECINIRGPATASAEKKRMKKTH